MNFFNQKNMKIDNKYIKNKNLKFYGMFNNNNKINLINIKFLKKKIFLKEIFITKMKMIWNYMKMKMNIDFIYIYIIFIYKNFQ